ncbi:pre-mRNA-splicing factor Cwc22p [[Candida] railenensis]|uniref:Pre-mRNA-splicing factor CWC22 n=1 Tax=[Candida] railenensis TaxID=45579 RepID=A0A9P0QSL4_9ASCO|nr:pre-mRNA-splicing factor Cwc22p [[Candida] railenensis]
MEDEYLKLLKLRAVGKDVSLSGAQPSSTDDDASGDFPQNGSQKSRWISTKKLIAKLLNETTVGNIKSISIEIFQKVNLFRYKGVFIRTLMKSLRVYEHLAPVYASLVAILNSKLPEIGELLTGRLILQFRRAYREGDKSQCIASITFLGHLVNQKVCSDVIILQILQLFLDKAPSSNTIYMSSILLKVVGHSLQQQSRDAFNMIFERLGIIIQEGLTDRRGQKVISRLLEMKRFSTFPKLQTELDLVDVEDRPDEHIITLTEEIKAMDELNIFKEESEEEYEDLEEEYKEFKSEVFPEEVDGAKDEVQGSNEVAKADVIEAQVQKADIPKDSGAVIDMTDGELLKFQKAVYLTVMSSMSSDEAVHKLMRMKTDNPETLVDMIVKCCSQEKTYSKYYGVIGERLCYQNAKWQNTFVAVFKQYYTSIHQYETNPLRNIAKFWGHLFASDRLAIDKSWNDIQLTQEDTNAASRIFIKFMFQEMVEELGIKELNNRLTEPYIRRHIRGLFPVVDVNWKDAEHIRFSINFFTAIGLGSLTEEMRTVLKGIPQPTREELEEERRSRRRARIGSRSRSGTRSGSESRSRSISRSRSRSRSSSYSRSRSGSSSRSASYSRSRSRSYSRSRSPSNSKSRSRSYSRSRSASNSRSPSRTPSRSNSPEHRETKRQKVEQ